MKEFRTVIVCDDKFYIKYLKAVYQAYQKFFPECRLHIVMIQWDGDKDYGVPIWRKYKKDERHHIIALCKMAKLHSLCEFGNDLVLINDMDRIPLNSRYIRSLLQYHINGSILTAGKEYYDCDKNERGKIPMAYSCGNSNIWKEVINPDGFSYQDFVKSLEGVYVFDHKEDCLGSQEKFSDESLFRALMHMRSFDKKKIIPVRRSFMIFQDTADRANWYLDKEKLYNGEYVEAHLPRPDAIPDEDVFLLEEYTA